MATGGAVLDRVTSSETLTIEDLTRRTFVTGVLASAFLIACGGDDEAEPTATSSSGFPVTVRHKFGETTITSQPQRIVAVGPTDEDPILALGVVPIGLTDWWGNYEAGSPWPWAQPHLGAATPTVIPLDGEQHFEEIAALQPDLILGQYCGMTSEEYDLFSRIAPTVAQSGDYEDWQTPWQTMTQTIATALGKPDLGARLIQGVQDSFDAAKAANPAFGQTTVLFVERGVGTFTIRGGNEPRVQVLTNMGLSVPEKYANPGPFGIDFSDEQLNILDEVDLVFWMADPASRDELLANPLYQSLRLTQEERHVFVVDETLSAAIYWSSVLSLPYAVETIAPMIAAAL